MNKEIFGIELKYWLASIPVWILIGITVIFPQIVFLILFLIMCLIIVFSITALIAYVTKDTIETIKEIKGLEKKG
jgi:hypothetical protein